MNKEVRINIIIFFVGVVMLLLGQTQYMSVTANSVLIGIGCSVIASSIVAYLNYFYSVRKSFANRITEKLGLKTFHYAKDEMPDINSSSETAILNASKQMDMIGYNFNSLSIMYGDLIKEKVKNGLQIRIMAVNPESININEMEYYNYNTIRGKAMDLDAWVKYLKSIAPDRENVQLRLLNTLIQNTYLRVDGHVFITPFAYMNSMNSMKRISYEFSERKKGFLYYTEVFEKMWETKKI